MPAKLLPQGAHIDHLKHQARDLQHAYRAGEMQAYQRVREFHPKRGDHSDTVLANQTLTLSEAQLCIAREYGYRSWARLREVVETGDQANLQKSYTERLTDPAFRKALDLMDAGDASGLEACLAAAPGLATQRVSFEGGNYFTNPTLIEFIAENPVRNDGIPPEALQVLEVLLDAGAGQDRAALNSTIGLLASGRVAHESGIGPDLIRRLCRAGADPATAVHSAIAHGEIEAVRLLVALGAPMDVAIAAGLGDPELMALYLPLANSGDLQLGLAWAANLGQVQTVSMLLDAGADPDRYNPPGGHSHCTPMHSAVASGHLSVVDLLVRRGARTDLRDIHHSATPPDWARHLGQVDLVAYFDGLPTREMPG